MTCWHTVQIELFLALLTCPHFTFRYLYCFNKGHHFTHYCVLGKYVISYFSRVWLHCCWTTVAVLLCPAQQLLSLLILRTLPEVDEGGVGSILAPAGSLAQECVKLLTFKIVFPTLLAVCNLTHPSPTCTSFKIVLDSETSCWYETASCNLQT